MKTFYVSTAGNDDWSGSLPRPQHDGNNGPFASLARARDMIRTLKAASQLPPGGIEVVVAGGEYALREPLTFTDKDSGTADSPVVYRAAQGETVRLSGGVQITDWDPIDDQDTLSQMHPDARGHVLQADLRAHGVSDFGTMTTAPGPGRSDPGLELFFRNQPMTLARYPNEGYLHIASLSVDDGHNIRGARGSHVGRFRVAEERDRLQRWAREPGLMLHGYWFWDWSDQRIAVTAIDPETGEITLDESHPHGYGYRAGQWFYAFNLLCELDRPGEWFLNRDTGILYFWPPAASGSHDVEADNLKAGDVTISVLRAPVTFDQVSHVTLQGFTLEATRGTGITVKEGEDIRIAGCTLRNLGGDAVHIEGGQRHAVSDCDIYRTGDGGIMLAGGDRCTLTPGRHEAVNNHIHHIARWNPVYKVGIQLTGCGNRAAHNRLHDLPHIAIGFTGNDQVVEYNEIYQSVTRANDAGAIYTSGAGPEDWSMRGHRIRFNFLHHLYGFDGEGCSGIYLDDMFSGTEIFGNILYRVYKGFLLGGGRDILSENNVFIDCPCSISLDARALGWAAFSMPDVIAGLKSMPYREEPWASRYPELVNILENEPGVPKGNVIARNIFRGGKGNNIEPEAKPGLRMGNNLNDEDPCFRDASRMDFRLRKDSRAWKLGFEPIPVEQIGPRITDLRPRLPVRQLIETEMIVERPPLFRARRFVHPGILRLRVRNVGDEADSCVIHLHVSGGHLSDGDPISCSLAPFETVERKCELLADAQALRLTAVREGVDGVVGALEAEATDEAITPWPAALRVSKPIPGIGRLDTLDRPPPTDTLQWHRVDDAPPRGHFFNVYKALNTTGEADSAIFFGCRVQCAEPMRAAVLLGYDGPVKLFLDDTAVFYDPDGAPPAQPDRAAPEIDLSRGEHELILALSAVNGPAWGIFMRLMRTDLDNNHEAELAPVLPQILSE
ncbi:MAG: right-handed parallel beta-helix repeat-containing protein [Candidatus Pacebacteria bacterium]|nr:right-handed parallel beta-helix repeat-containing protein [Candidatus Paceibacterota bacterium]